MNKEINNSVIIFKDKPASGGLYLSGFVYFLFFAIAAVWLIGMISEFYILDTDFVIGVGILSILMFLFGWRLARKIKSIINVEKEKPLIKVGADGIEILGDKLRPWADIKLIRLITDFDAKYIELTSYNEDDSMNYMLYSPFETHEFKVLTALESILNRFTDKVQLLEY